MKKNSLHCQKCGSLLDSDQDKRTALCSRCKKRLARRVRFRSSTEGQGYIGLGMGLEKLGE